MLKLKYIWIGLILCMTFSVNHASVSHDLESVFNKLGQGANVTQPQHYEGQRAGYYTGGSIFTRTPVREYSIAHVQMPNIKAGCGGIDLFTGGFSFISAKELKSALENITSNVPSYALLLGLETVSPLIKNQMMELQKMANDINRMNINSCETTTLLAGSLWPKTEEASRKICEDIGVSNNQFSDRVKARHECSSLSRRKNVINSVKNDDEWKDIIIDNTNLAWQVIQKNKFYSLDSELSEFLLSLSGTLIIKEDKPIQLDSLVTHPGFLKSLLVGGEIKLYHCDNSKCLNPSVKSTFIPESQGFQSQVEAILNRMLDNIQQDRLLSQNDIAFLETTSLPVYKMLNVESAFYGQSQILNLIDYSDVIALDLLFNYLNENLNYLNRGLQTLAFPEPVMQSYKSMLSQTKRFVNQERQRLMQTKTVNTQLIEKTQMLERMLAGQLASDLAQGQGS